MSADIGKGGRANVENMEQDEVGTGASEKSMHEHVKEEDEEQVAERRKANAQEGGHARAGGVDAESHGADTHADDACAHEEEQGAHGDTENDSEDEDEEGGEPQDTESESESSQQQRRQELGTGRSGSPEAQVNVSFVESSRECQNTENQAREDGVTSTSQEGSASLVLRILAFP